MASKRSAPPGMHADVPPPQREGPDWSAAAEWLRSHPTQWLLVYEHGRNSWKEAAAQGHVAVVHPRLGFEFRTTDNTRDTPRMCTLFMRYDPDQADPLAELVNGTERGT